MDPAPIFLILNGETDGPHNLDDLEAMVGEEQIPADTLACVEGMPGWRCIPETIVWAQIPWLTGCMEEAIQMMSRVADFRLEPRDLRLEVRNLLTRQGIYNREPDGVCTLIETAGALQRMHERYSQKAQEWNLASIEFYPALELTMFGTQRFVRDWNKVWEEAGGRLYSDRKIARHADPVWSKISDFGYPFPPFSFDSAPWITVVPYQEALECGVSDIDLIRLSNPVNGFDPFVFTRFGSVAPRT